MAGAFSASSFGYAGNSGGFKAGSLFGTSGSTGKSVEDTGVNTVKGILNVLNRPGQAVMQGLHPFSGQGVHTFDPQNLLAGAKGFASGLTDIGGTHDITPFQEENVDPNAPAFQVKLPGTNVTTGTALGFAGSVFQDPTLVIGPEARAFKSALDVIKGAKGADLAAEVSAKGFNGLEDAKKAQIVDALKNSENAKNFKGGQQAFVEHMIGSGKGGLTQKLGVLSEPKGLRLAGKTVLPSTVTHGVLEATQIPKLAKMAGETKYGKAIASVASKRAPIMSALGKDTAEAVRQAENDALGTKNTIQHDVVNKFNSIKGRLSKEDMADVQHAVETGNTNRAIRVALSQGNQTKADVIRGIVDQLRENGTHELNHYVDPKVAKSLDKVAGSLGRAMGFVPEAGRVATQVEEHLDRFMPGASTAEKNAALSEATGLDRNIIETDPVKAVLRDTMKRANDEGDRVLHESLSKIQHNGVPIAKILQGSEQGSLPGLEGVTQSIKNNPAVEPLLKASQDLAKTSLPGADGLVHKMTPAGEMLMHPAVADYVSKLQKTFNSDAEMRALGSLFKTLNRVWRGQATSALFMAGAPFQAHIHVGNAINMFLAGFRNVALIPHTMQMRKVVQTAAKKGVPLLKAIDQSSMSARDKMVLKAALKKNVVHGSYLRTDLEGPMHNLTKGGVGQRAENAFNTITGAKVGAKLYGVAEDNMRLAMFYDTFDKTGSFDEAERAVKETLFNHQDLSKGEKALKNVIPFYVWQKNNIPFQLNMLMRVPGRERAVEQAQAALLQRTNDPNYDPSQAPPWAQAGNMYYLGSVQGSPFYGAFPTPMRSASDTLSVPINFATGHPQAAGTTAEGFIGNLLPSLGKQTVAEAGGHDLFTHKALPQGYVPPAKRYAEAASPGVSKLESLIKALRSNNSAKQRAKLINQLTGVSTTS